MTLKQTMAALKKLGTAQHRKTYARHGAGENMFGVSFANLNQLKKKIGTDHQLAEQLWQTGNVDAMSLATMIADPRQFTARSADEWLAAVDFRMVAGLLAGVIARSDLAAAKIRKWTRSRKEYTRAVGYDVLSHWLRDSPEAVDPALAEGYLQTIEKQIHSAANEARYAMNGALIAIGTFKPELRSVVIAAAKRIGKVEVDHGDTSCKTPDAVAYIGKVAEREKATGKTPRRRVTC